MLKRELQECGAHLVDSPFLGRNILVVGWLETESEGPHRVDGGADVPTARNGVVDGLDVNEPSFADSHCTTLNSKV
jgi:hypothetical protein